MGPCFDEPDKKATFQLTIVHPTELAAYSNTAGETEVYENGRSRTFFERTVPLPTYAVALALTNQDVMEIELDGHKVRPLLTLKMRRFLSMCLSFRLRQVLQEYENLEHQRCNSDWLIVEDFTYAAMKNPGLITSRPDETYETNRIHEIAHQYFGNLVTLRSWEQIWLNEGFARFFE
ncbi:hypothetical protein PENTCL1PPCAC_8099, partial [Pristionchus entomophagus]